MGLLSFFKRNRGAAGAAAPAKGAADSVAAARAKARQRLIGAVVLVVIAIIGFPLLFETQPRPVAIDIPIEIPSPESAPPLSVPGAAPATPADATAAPHEAPAPKDDAVTEAAAPARQDAPVAAPTAKPDEPATVVRPAHRPATEPKVKTAPERPAPPPAAATRPAREADRVQALLEGKPTPAARENAKGSAPESAARFVVQVGAFADAAAARDMRSKIEKLGLKTYTQVVKTSAGNRTRVRLGPFASREEADKVSGRIKSAGLQSVVLTL